MLMTFYTFGIMQNLRLLYDGASDSPMTLERFRECYQPPQWVRYATRLIQSML